MPLCILPFSVFTFPVYEFCISIVVQNVIPTSGFYNLTFISRFSHCIRVFWMFVPVRSSVGPADLLNCSPQELINPRTFSRRDVGELATRFDDEAKKRLSKSVSDCISIAQRGFVERRKKDPDCATRDVRGLVPVKEVEFEPLHESHGSVCTVSFHTISGSHGAGPRFTTVHICLSDCF